MNERTGLCLKDKQKTQGFFLYHLPVWLPVILLWLCGNALVVHPLIQAPVIKVGKKENCGKKPFLILVRWQ